VHPPPQFLFHRQKLCLQPIAPGFPPEQKLAASRLAADHRKAQEVEGLRPAFPALLSSSRRLAAKGATYNAYLLALMVSRQIYGVRTQLAASSPRSVLRGCLGVIQCIQSDA
jgi:hypothetical protein